MSPEELDAIEALYVRKCALITGIGPGNERAAIVSDPAALHVLPLVAEVRRLWVERDAVGHCHHAPKCIGRGPPGERDPLGCCNCGTREGEVRCALCRGSGVIETGNNDERCACPLGALAKMNEAR